VSPLAETLAALANNGGGTLVLPATALEPPAIVLDNAVQAALATVPPMVMPLPQIDKMGNSVTVTVPAGLPHVYSVDGRYLVREGTENRPLAPDRLRQLLLERGEISFEEASISGATLDDLDWTAAEVYTARIGAESAREILLRRGCLVSEHGELHPTYAGILLFGRDPLRFVRSAYLTAARFAGTAPSDHFTSQEISGSLPNQVRRAEAFLIDNMRRAVQLGATSERSEKFEYPLEAARELVVNAIAHRDYAIRGEGIRLFVFADRLEITSPGKLSGPVTIENIADERFSRNSIIVQVLADMGFIERLGYGIDRILALTRTQHMPPPEFIETAGGFRATLRRLPQIDEKVLSNSSLAAELNPRQQAAVTYLDTHPRITNHELQALYSTVHPETIRRDLADLVARGLLEKLGQKRGSYYVRARRS